MSNNKKYTNQPNLLVQAIHLYIIIIIFFFFVVVFFFFGHLEECTNLHG